MSAEPRDLGTGEPDIAAADSQQAVASLQALLRHYGIETSRQALVEECETDYSLAAMARCIERRGMSARIISIMPTDLRNLGVGLVELRDRTLALVCSDRGRNVRLELPNGSSVRAAEDIEHLASGTAVEVAPPWSKTGSFLRRIATMCIEDPRVRSSLLLFCVTLLLSGALGFAQPAIAKQIIDRAIPENAPRLLVVLALLLFFLAAVSALIGNLSERAAIYVEKRLAVAAHRGILEHYLALPFPSLQSETAGSAVQTLGGVPAIIRGVVHGAVSGTIDLLLGLGYLFWIVALAPELTAALVLAHVVLAVVAIPSAQHAARQQQAVLAASAEQSDRLLELVNRVATLRAAVAFDWALRRWQRALRRAQEHGLKLELTSSFVTELVGLVQRLVVGITVLWMAHATLLGERTLGEFFAVVAAVTASSGAFMRLISRGAALFPTRAQLGRIDDLLARETVAQAASSSLGLRPEEGIVIEGLWFRYGENLPWVVRNYSTSFAGGTLHTIRWPSGHGKSTLLRVIAGLYPPSKGAVTIHGLDASAARHLVAYVPQNCPIFAGSVLHNLRTLSGDAPQERIDAAVAATGLGLIAEQWPMGLETVVSGGSGNISSGQRQLVIFTAALASRRPILLLDEATTHLDLILRVGLRDSPLLRGRTIVNVMHFDDMSPDESD